VGIKEKLVSLAEAQRKAFIVFRRSGTARHRAATKHTVSVGSARPTLKMFFSAPLREIILCFRYEEADLIKISLPGVLGCSG